MAAGHLIIADLRGGRNGIDPPELLQDTECQEALNVDWQNGASLAHRRNGASSLGMTSTRLTGVISSLHRHVPGTDETAAELWATDDGGHVDRLAGGTTWSGPTFADAPTGNGWDFSMASLNGLNFIAYQSAQDRLHCWDGGTVRRAGLQTPSAAPTAANTGGVGTYAATVRYYRVRWITMSGSVLLRRSEPGPSLSFTPDGSHAQVTVTRPTAPGEGETHWELEGSADNATFYQLYGVDRGASQIAIATTGGDDANAPSSYPTFPLTASTGTYQVFPSVKFLKADQNRLLGFGSWTSTNKQNRIWFSAVVGALNIGDAERQPLNSYVDLDENDSSVATGLAGPVNGSFFAFKFRQFWKLTPNGNVLTVYDTKAISKFVGSVGPRAIAVGEDEIGFPTVYFWSHRGPYRYGRNGLEYIGRGVEDITAMVNLAATKQIALAVYHADRREVWFWVATGSNNDPDTKVVFSVGRAPMGMAVSDHPVPSGWAKHTGNSANARCAVLFSNTVGSSMSRDLKPYIGYAGANATILKCDDATVNQDNGTSYQAYVKTKAYAPWGIGKNGAVKPGELIALAASNVTITQTVDGGFGEETRTSSVSLTAAGSETRVQRKFEDAELQGHGTVAYQWGDASTANVAWTLDLAHSWWESEEQR